HLHHALLDALAAEPLMQPQGLGDLAADGEDRIEARHRFLEDHADIVAADLAHGALAELEQVPALEPYRAPDSSGRVWPRPPTGVGAPRLSAAALADDRHRLAGLDRERDAIDRAVPPVRRAEVGLQVIDFQQRHAANSSQSFGQARIERIAQAVAEQVDRKHRDRKENRGEEHDVGFDLPQRAAFGHDVAPGWD